MAGLPEKDVYNALLKCRGQSQTMNIGNAEVQIALRPQDNHASDSPDFLLWVEMAVHVFGQPLDIRIPIPVEAEKAGIDAAEEDLEKFVKRARFPIHVPMLVVAAKGFATRERQGTLPVRFTMRQVPVKVLDDSQRGKVCE